LIVDTSISFNFKDVTRSGTTKPLYKWVLDYVDVAMMMSYRNFLDGPNGILALSRPSVDYATSIGKKVIVGVETSDEDPSYVTFYGLNTTYLESFLNQVTANYSGQSGFLGVAVHDWTAYQLLSNSPIPSSCNPKGFFVWQSGVATNLQTRSTYFTFATSRCVKSTYLESEYLIKNEQAALKDFWRISKENNMDLQFLYGASEWARTAQHPYVLSLVNLTRTFVEEIIIMATSSSSTSSASTASSSSSTSKATTSTNAQSSSATTKKAASSSSTNSQTTTSTTRSATIATSRQSTTSTLGPTGSSTVVPSDSPSPGNPLFPSVTLFLSLFLFLICCF
jgi:hypothetical protein